MKKIRFKKLTKNSFLGIMAIVVMVIGNIFSVKYIPYLEEGAGAICAISLSISVILCCAIILHALESGCVYLVSDKK